MSDSATAASLFDCEDAHLLALHLLKQAQSKLGPVFDAIGRDHEGADDQSNVDFRKATWKKSLSSAREWRHTQDTVDASLKPLYKSCLSFYIRSVLLRSSQRAVPKMHHFVKRFFSELIDSYDMQTGNFFNRFGHQDQLSATRAAMRLALHKLMAVKPVGMSQISILSGGSRAARHRDDAHVPSVGPDDSVSVATFSRLMPPPKRHTPPPKRHTRHAEPAVEKRHTKRRSTHGSSSRAGHSRLSRRSQILERPAVRASTADRVSVANGTADRVSAVNRPPSKLPEYKETEDDSGNDSDDVHVSDVTHITENSVRRVRT